MQIRLFRSRLAQLLAVALVLVAAWLQSGRDDATDATAGRTAIPGQAALSPGLIERAFETHQSNLLVTEQGRIVRVLEDDRDGARHQRFVVALDSGITVLIAHNIDLAPRVQDPRVGEPIVFHGEYEWNDRGGVIHWTHHDPDGTHEGGWLEYAGIRYD